MPSLPITEIPPPDAYAPTPDSPPIIYLIRHGEKNDNASEGSLIGLNGDGIARANALPGVFNAGGDNPYNIRVMFPMHPKSDGGEERPWQTVIPLSISLQQTLVNSKDDKYFLIDNTVFRGDEDKLAKKIQDYIESGGTGNILICWEHHHLFNILDSFGFKGAPQYPGLFDVVWMLKPTPVEGTDHSFAWDTIKWSSERTEADLKLANDASAWLKKAGVSDTLTTQSSTPGTPKYKWKPKKDKSPVSNDG